MACSRQGSSTLTVTNVDSSDTTSHPSTSLHSMFMCMFILVSVAKALEAFRAPGALSVIMMKIGPYNISLKSTERACLSREVSPPAAVFPSPR